MATIYADIDQLKYFQEQWSDLPSQLEASVSDRDTLISETRTALDRGIMEAEEIQNQTRLALQQAQEELDRAKRYEDGNIERLTRLVAQCERKDDWARQQLEKLQAQRDFFDEESARYITKQDQSLAKIKSLGKKGRDWLANYMDRLLEAKRAIFEDAASGSKSFLTADGGYVNARDLTEEEAAQLYQKTGWPENTLKKCQLRPDGSVWLKTNNCIHDSERYRSTWFERDTVIIGEVRVEGIFPKFDAAFEPDIPMPEDLWKNKGSDYTAHFAWCRHQLKDAVAQNPALASQFTAAERKLIEDEQQLPGYTWHHHQQPGRMQLVSSKKHSAAMHGVSHTGGNALWCTRIPLS